MIAISEMQKKRTDPDPVSIMALLIAGVSLLPVLEQKLEARRAEHRTNSDEKAKRSCSLNLARISLAIEEVDNFLSFFRTVGEIQRLSEEESGFGSYGLFISTDDISLFSNRVDILLDAIGTINREVLSMPLHNLILDEKDVQSLYTPLRNIRIAANQFLFYPTLEAGLLAAPIILNEARKFTLLLSAILHI